MCVDIRRGIDSAVPKPNLYVLQRDAVGIEQAGAAVPEIVKPNTPHPVFLQHFRKASGEHVRADEIAKYVYVDVV